MLKVYIKLEEMCDLLKRLLNSKKALCDFSKYNVPSVRGAVCKVTQSKFKSNIFGNLAYCIRKKSEKNHIFIQLIISKFQIKYLDCQLNIL